MSWTCAQRMRSRVWIGVVSDVAARVGASSSVATVLRNPSSSSTSTRAASQRSRKFLANRSTTCCSVLADQQTVLAITCSACSFEGADDQRRHDVGAAWVEDGPDGVGAQRFSTRELHRSVGLCSPCRWQDHPSLHFVRRLLQSISARYSDATFSRLP